MQYLICYSNKHKIAELDTRPCFQATELLVLALNLYLLLLLQDTETLQFSFFFLRVTEALLHCQALSHCHFAQMKQLWSVQLWKVAPLL